MDYAKKGHRVELAGRADVDGQPAYKLQVVLKDARDGDADDYFIDAKSWLLVQIKGQRTIAGVQTTYRRTFRDYKPVGGVLIPHTRADVNSGAGEDQTYKMVLDQAEVNLDLPDDRFTLAAAASQAATAAASATQPASAPAAVRDDPAAHAPV